MIPGSTLPSAALERHLKERGKAERRANGSESHAVAGRVAAERPGKFIFVKNSK